MTNLRTQLTFRVIFASALVIYIVMFTSNSVSRTRLFSPDSMNYVAVAPKRLTWKGLVQSTLGFNQPHLFTSESAIATPMTAQPPVYPLVIALVARFGIPHATGALLVSAVAYGVLLLLVFLCVALMFGYNPGLVTASLVLVFTPMPYVARHAWSETTAVSLLVLSIIFFVVANLPERSAPGRYLLLALAGASACVALFTRLALAPILLVLLVSLLIERRHGGDRLQSVAALVSGMLLVAISFLVIASVTNTLSSMVPQYLPSDRTFAQNMSDALHVFWTSFTWDGVVLGQHILGPNGRHIFAVAVAAAIIALGLWCFLCATSLRSLISHRQRYVLLLFSLFYLVVVIGQRTVYHFDALDERLLFPAMLTLLIVVSGLMTQTAPRSAVKVLLLLALGIVCLAVLREARLAYATAPRDDGSEIQSSPRLQWIAANVSDSDLVIGDDTVDVPFYFGWEAVSISPYPYTRHIGLQELLAFVDDKCSDYERFFLVLRERGLDPAHNEYAFGPDIAGLLMLESQRDNRRIIPITHLPDAMIYEISTGGCR